MTLPGPIPEPPAWRVDWGAIDRSWPWIQAMRGAPQDPRHHAEGDVWIHVRMVCEALAAMPGWRALPAAERAIVFWAALLHDVAKPRCTRTDADGRITARGHSEKGAIQARQILWRAGVPFGVREAVVGLVRFHQRPFHLIERDDCRRSAFEISLGARCDHLALLAEADARGRVCADMQRLLDNVSLFAELCREHDCLDRPRAFPSDHSRFVFFRDADLQVEYAAHERFRTEVVLLSGLPGAGKDTWLRDHAPDLAVVSLDDLRRALGVAPEDAQGRVLQAARDQARSYLRRAEPFAWNATNLSRRIRRQCIDLFAAYGARVRIAYLDVPAEDLYHRNERRTHRLPRAVLDRLLDRWEVPSLTEAHAVDYVTAA